jgi:hypothetical protein
MSARATGAVAAVIPTKAIFIAKWLLVTGSTLAHARVPRPQA